MTARVSAAVLALLVLLASAPSATAAPHGTVLLAPESGCESGRLLVTSEGIDGGRQFRRATWSDQTSSDVVLFEREEAGPSGSHTGALDFPFVTGAVPYGIAVTLYGYQGSTPPSPETTVEFSVTYFCETLEIISSSAGPYGATDAPLARNHDGLWWASPAGSESGWGIYVTHQADVIFATWFTYDASGKAWWLSMPASRTADGSYAGTLFETHGPAFNAVPFDRNGVRTTAAGTGALRFTDGSNGTFTYVIDGVTQTKGITREAFGVLPVCAFGPESDLAAASNYQGLWYAAPAESESGWGVNLAHQGDVIFATWFTYDAQGAPLWLSAATARTNARTYAGTLYRTSGPAFGAVPFDPANVRASAVGTLSITFASGNAATFAYALALDGVTVSQARPITRQVFRTPVTICR